MARYKAPTINEQGGLAVYLETPKQLALHNGNGYQLWRAMTDAKASIKARARAFHVSDGTIRGWIKSEQEKTDA